MGNFNSKLWRNGKYSNRTLQWGKRPIHEILFLRILSCTPVGVVRNCEMDHVDEGDIMKMLGHLKTINHHKKLVMQHCFKVGLYKQGILHDMSKYSPTEFLVGCMYYQGNRSPNNAEREDKGYSKAWLHHKGRNKHHYEYWIDYSLDPKEGIVGLPMPTEYVVEMCMDRIAASKTYMGDKYDSSQPYFH